ncbi:MAG: uracil-xanthine permease family protein [Oligosphaeraceae bacterium]
MAQKKFLGYEAKEYLLGVQHLLAMFGSTVLVPLITGISPAVALFTAGVGTLLFHLVTGGKVPVFLGSSFAFIGVLCTVIQNQGLPYAQGGIMMAGGVYFLFAILARCIGSARIRALFPPVVTGPVIIIIGLSLAGVGVKDALFDGASPFYNGTTLLNAVVAIVTFTVMAASMNCANGLLKIIPILLGIAVGYILCCVLYALGLFSMDFSSIRDATWLNIPYQNGFLSLPRFDLTAMVTIAPVALVTFMEHIGDITTNGAVVGKDFFQSPGLHRTLLGDGLATMVAGFLGGPANTTYSENTGVLATTRNYNPAVLRLAAVFAILLGCVGKFGAILLTIPGPVKGGVEIMLFGMIAAIGIRTIAESKLDMTNNRNLSVMAGTFCTGLGLNAIGGINLTIHGIALNISALFVATVVGVLLNLFLPGPRNIKVAEEKK